MLAWWAASTGGVDDFWLISTLLFPYYTPLAQVQNPYHQPDALIGGVTDMKVLLWLQLQDPPLQKDGRNLAIATFPPCLPLLERLTL